MSLKSGRKSRYTGGSFASRFKTGLAMKSPFNVVVAGQAEQLSDAAKAKQELDTKSIDPSDHSEKSSVDRDATTAWFQRKKLAEEQEAAKKASEEAAKAEATAKEKAEAAAKTGGDADPTKTKGGKDQTYTDDFDSDGTKKDVRKEKRENKKEIRDAKKDAKKNANPNRFGWSYVPMRS